MNLELKCHTMFYLALGRLLLVELGEDEEKFDRFISPLISMCVCVVIVVVVVVCAHLLDVHVCVDVIYVCT